MLFTFLFTTTITTTTGNTDWCVDEEIDAVITEEDGASHVNPTSRPVRFRWVVRQLLKQLGLAYVGVLQQPNIV